MTHLRAAALGRGILLAAALYLYLGQVSQRGLVGPDEPRYASIARHMAESGDFVTPVLWGDPWFEKPSMLFWLGAAGALSGIDSYTRVPVALLCLGFLAFLYWVLAKAFDAETGVCATCILATSAGWVAYADAGVFDAPLAVFVSAALLCLLPWVLDPERPGRVWIPCFGALLGLGVLSKGLVAPVVAALALLPVAWQRPRRAASLLGARALAPFAVACLPWYVACYWRNGRVFVDEFLVKHHWERFFSSSLQHVQPWWFYLPVLLAFLLPWSPLLLGLRRESLWADPARRFLAAWALGPILFFSLSVNKLPAYILPALPPLAILLTLEWRRRPRPALLLAAACTLALAPLAATLLPAGLADGITRAWAALGPAEVSLAVGAGALLAGCGIMALKYGGPAALPAVALIAAASLTLVKFIAYPAASRVAGARELVAEAEARGGACLGETRRHVVYGVRHYSRDAMRSCEERPRPFRIEGDPPRIVASDGEPASP